MKKKPWWEEEWISENQKIETIDWIKQNTILKEIADKEEQIVKEYKYEVAVIKEKIKMLEKQIKDKEKECSECLAKIHIGDSGLMEIIVERNIQDLIQTQEEKDQNLLLTENGSETKTVKNGAEDGHQKKSTLDMVTQKNMEK